VFDKAVEAVDGVSLINHKIFTISFNLKYYISLISHFHIISWIIFFTIKYYHKIKAKI